VDFEIVGPLREVETIASGRAIRERRRLQKFYGRGRWRKIRGIATELHWYEAHGNGRKEFKIKRLLPSP